MLVEKKVILLHSDDKRRQLPGNVQQSKAISH